MSTGVAALLAVLFVSVNAGGNGNNVGGKAGILQTATNNAAKANNNNFPTGVLVPTNFQNSGLIGAAAKGSAHITFNNNQGQPVNNNNFQKTGTLLGATNNNNKMSVNSFVQNAYAKGFTSSQVNSFLAAAQNQNNGRSTINNAVANIPAQYVSVQPTESWLNVEYHSPYTYIEHYSHHVAHIYVSETCPPPPSSMEVCLSYIFNSMEKYIKIVKSSLIKHEISIHNYMHHEHSLLTSEISWAASVNRIAYGVKKAVHIDYQDISIELSQLYEQKKIIYYLYYDLTYELNEIVEDVSVNIKEINYLKQEYNYVKTAKWQLYGYISAILYEKGAVAVAINEIQVVVTQMRAQITKIYSKITQLNKRQTWLLNWENKLYVDLTAFSKDVTKFRSVQSNLYKRQMSLYAQQTRLKKEAIYAKEAIAQLKMEYHSVAEYLNYLYVYQKNIISIYGDVYSEAKYFISAYEMFTCQDNLLYYEACSSAAAPAAPPAKAAKPAKPAAPAANNANAAAKAAAATAKSAANVKKTSTKTSTKTKPTGTKTSTKTVTKTTNKGK